MTRQDKQRVAVEAAIARLKAKIDRKQAKIDRKEAEIDDVRSVFIALGFWCDLMDNDEALAAMKAAAEDAS